MNDANNPFLEMIRSIKQAVRAARSVGLDEATIRDDVMSMVAIATDAPEAGARFVAGLAERALADAFTETI